MNTATALLRSARRRNLLLSAYNNVIIGSGKPSWSSSYVKRPIVPLLGSYMGRSYTSQSGNNGMGVTAIRFEDGVFRAKLPQSLGIESSGGVFTELVKRNTRLPVDVTKVFTTTSDRQSGFKIKVYQGEGAMAAENKLVGETELDIAPGMGGKARVSVRAIVCERGRVTVYAKDEYTGRVQQIMIPSNQREWKELAEVVSTEEDEPDLLLLFFRFLFRTVGALILASVLWLLSISPRD